MGMAHNKNPLCTNKWLHPEEYSILLFWISYRRTGKEIFHSIVKSFSCLKWKLGWSPSLWRHASSSLYCCILPSMLNLLQPFTEMFVKSHCTNCTTAFTRVWVFSRNSRKLMHCFNFSAMHCFTFSSVFSPLQTFAKMDTPTTGSLEDRYLGVLLDDLCLHL